jgi:hypothetical protein
VSAGLTGRAAVDGPKVLSIPGSGLVTADWGGKETRIETGQSVGKWTLMAVVRGAVGGRLAVFEDFSQTNGHLLIADTKGVKLDLPKSSEPTRADPKSLYRGHSLEEVFRSEQDLLGEEILAKPSDPDYAEVAACFPPISKMYTYTFVGTHECLEKVGVMYGGSTPNFDPVAYVPAIQKIRDEGRVLDGLVGGLAAGAEDRVPGEAGRLVGADHLCSDAGRERQPAGAAGLVPVEPD